MAKLVKGTLENIEMKEIKSLLKENKDVSGFSDYVKNYVNTVLIKENKKIFNKEDFEIMEGYIENIGEYQKILKENYEYGKFSISLVEKLVRLSIDSGKNFKDCYININENMNRILNYSKENRLEFIINLYNIKTFRDFESLCNNKNIYNFLNHVKGKSLQYIMELYQIYNLKDFESFYNNENILNCLTYSNINLLKLVIDSYNIKTFKDFESLCNNKSITRVLSHDYELRLENTKNIIKSCETFEKFEMFCNVFSNSEYKNLELVINHIFKDSIIIKNEKSFLDDTNKIKLINNLYNENKLKYIDDLCNNKNTRHILLLANFENLEHFIVGNNIKTIQEFEYLCENENVGNLLSYSEEKNLENLIKLCKTPQEFKSMCEYENTIEFLKNVKEENLEFLSNNLDGNVIKNIISHINYERIDRINIENIENHKLGKNFGFFLESFNIIDLEKIDFPITESNFLDFMQDDDILINFEKDNGTVFEGIQPWSKKWFLDKPERKEYLNPDKIKTFEKFGSIIAIGLIEGAQNQESLKNFYNYIFKTINQYKSRSSILQIGEVFNLILKQENYEIFDDIVVNSNIGTEFREFIEENKISNKGRTILTLLISREIRDSFQIFKNPDGKQEIDFSSIETLIKRVQDKLKLYKVEIDKYKNLPIKTSIGMEYEVTKSIAKGYEEEIGSDYKNDIEIISEYAEVAKGNDAVHEIATSPTDNPMLLILEMKLLEDLDFLDLNFKKEDYARGSRGIHITLGGEYGISLDNNSNFIQNILIASNIGGLNAGKEVNGVNRYSNIKEKGYDCEAVFGRDKTPTLEYRSLSIDKKEQFERLILSIFNLNMAKQACDKYLNSRDLSFKNERVLNSNNKNLSLSLDNLESIEKFKNFIIKNNLLDKEISNDKIWISMYDFLKLKKDIIEIIENHNKNFVKDETIDNEKQENISRLFSLMTSTGPVIQIMQKVGVDIYYFKSLKEKQFSREEFEIKLKSDGKNLSILTERQKEILFGEYDLRIRKELSKIKENDREIYDNIGDYLNGSTEETQRKITNSKRWKEVIGENNEYLDSLSIGNSELFIKITPELINKFTKINNLFIKKDSTNALATLDNTLESDGTQISDRRLAETTIFDKLDMGLKQRNGYNIIQGASENMLTQAIQRRILEFNENLFG